LALVTLIEFMYGVLASSLGLMSAAFHTTFDCISMAISLVAMILAKQQPTKKYSYGYDRCETLSGFTNGVFLLFVSLFLFKEVVERFLEPVEFQAAHFEGVLFVAVLAMIVNVIGVVFFRHHALVRIESRHSAHDENISSILIHIFVDVIANIAVIFSTWLMRMGFLLADPLIALAIVVLIGYNALPICQKTGRILLQTTPLSIKDQLDKVLREASTLEGVLECRNEHFWTQSPGVFVGSLYVRIRSDANEQQVLSRVTSLFAPLVTHLTVQVEKDDWALPTTSPVSNNISVSSNNDSHQ